MPDKARDDLDLKTASAEAINEQMKLGSRRALLEHKRAGQSIVVWDRENDRILTVPPEQIAIEGGSETEEQDPQGQRPAKNRRASLHSKS